MRYTYTVLLTEKDGKTYARIPDLDGCISTGSDIADAVEQITDAMAAWLCTAEDEGIPVPAPTPQTSIKDADRSIVTLVSADTMKYRAMTDTRAVRKNVSLPAWLLRMAEQRRINCSQVLQEALLARIHA